MGCATTRTVTLDTGRGDPPIVYRPSQTRPVEVARAAFEEGVTRLVLGMRLDVALREAEATERRSLLASSRGVVDGARGRTGEPKRLMPDGFTLGLMERRGMALSFALDTVWEGVEVALQDVTDPDALRAMVVSLIGTSLVMLVAPEPVTKFVALALTACLIAYLGTGPVWHLGQAFLLLMEETAEATSTEQLKDVGHRFGKVLGDNGARVLILVAMAALGGRSGMAVQGPRMPGFTQAALKAQVEGGFQLSGALAGEVHSISLSAAGVLDIALAPTAVAAVAMGPGGGIQGDPDGEVHHICTDKNEVSASSGGPWTRIFEDFFRRAGLKLSDTVNQVRIRGHKGPHPREYHQEVYRRLQLATQGCRGVESCRRALTDELMRIATDLTTDGTLLRKLVTRNPEG
nr:AHH domain-containing protein [Corallococcus soli]